MRCCFLVSSSKRPKKPAVEMTLGCDWGDKGLMKKVALENICSGMSEKASLIWKQFRRVDFSPGRTVSRGLILLKKVNDLKRRFDSEQNTGLDLSTSSLHEADTHSLSSNNRTSWFFYGAAFYYWPFTLCKDLQDQWQKQKWHTPNLLYTTLT